MTKESMDQLIKEGFEKAKEVARGHPGALLWTSLPCTAGCPWWGINERRPNGRKHRRRHVRELLALLQSWEQVAQVVKERAGCVASEWPRGCWLWKHPKVVEVISRFDLDAAVFDGCAFGLLSTSGKSKPLIFRSHGP